MAITLLAVDDSVTMRKVLEITFAGPEFRVVTANSPDVALQKLRTDKPDLVISDISLEPKNGYELCKAVKQLAPGTPVLLLSSKQNPFDQGRGANAQADEHMDKPFDTQQMIEKVKKMLQSKGESHAAPQGARPAITAPAVRPPTSPAIPAAAAAAAAAAGTPARAKTLIYNPPGAQAAPAPAAAARPPMGAGLTPASPKAETRPLTSSPTPPAGIPKQAPAGQRPAPTTLSATSPMGAAAPAAAAAGPVAGAAAAHISGQMSAKLETLGLSQTQIEAVLALSRDVVERVVWEVVPVLAETLIKEELARLTKA